MNIKNSLKLNVKIKRGKRFMIILVKEDRKPGIPGEVVDKDLGRYVPLRFSTMGSLELTFQLETGVTSTKFC